MILSRPAGKPGRNLPPSGGGVKPPDHSQSAALPGDAGRLGPLLARGVIFCINRVIDKTVC